MEPQFLPLAEVAKGLSLSKSTLQNRLGHDNYIHLGTRSLFTVKIAGKRMVPRRVFDEFVAAAHADGGLLTAQSHPSPQPENPPKRGPGRPRKTTV